MSRPNRGQLVILRDLLRRGPSTRQGLSARLPYASGTVRQYLGVLKRGGFVRMSESTHRFRLTPEGEQEARAGWDITKETNEGTDQ